MPWDVERMTLSELGRHHEGWLWRRSRDMKVLAVAVGWICQMVNELNNESRVEVDDEVIARSFPGYRPE